MQYVEDEVAQSIAGVDLAGIVILGQDDPETLLRWVYQNLGIDDAVPLDRDWLVALHRSATQSIAENPTQEFCYCLQLCRYPVDVRTFLFSPQYLNKGRDDIYPEVLQELVKINNPNNTRVVNMYAEAVFTGGIGSAKSTTALYTVAYQLYVLSCFDNPHNTFGLDPASEILFVFLGMAGDTANADYKRFYSMIIDSPYFRGVFPFNPRKKRELDFPHRIQVVEGINTIGQNVMGGMMDEVNFGDIVQNSKRSMDGGEYNATLTTYNGLARRRKSRFQTNGASPGILCLVSSKRYPGEFTDKKLAEAKYDPSIYVYDKRVWDVKPPGTFSSRKFQVFIGDAGRKAMVVDSSFQVEEGDADKIVDVPIDFIKDFNDDLIGSLRDIAGVSTLARYPFIQNVNAVSSSFGKHPSVLNLEETDFVSRQLKFLPKSFVNTQHQRWVHIDLGVTSDSAGVSCGYVPFFHPETNEASPMPQINFDFILRAKPPRNGEIQFHKIRSLLVMLRQHGLPITWVSFDSFQSVDSIQLLRQMGFSTGRVSMDLSTQPYATAKTAFYAGRVAAPTHVVAQREFISLEKDAKTGKIDHPSAGSKDCSDAMAGVIYGLTMRREIWASHNVPFAAQYRNSKEVAVEGKKED